MTEINFPVTLHHPESKVPDGKPPRLLHARDQQELDNLLRVGWKVKES